MVVNPADCPDRWPTEFDRTALRRYETTFKSMGEKKTLQRTTIFGISCGAQFVNHLQSAVLE